MQQTAHRLRCRLPDSIIMATLLEQTRARPAREYFDKTLFASLAAHQAAKERSSTVYVGGLSEFTTEQQLHAVFSLCGSVRRVVMGLHRVERKPCGFCFVEFERRQAAVDAERLLSGVELDAKAIKVEIDPGFVDGRQYGRARSGGQAQEDRRGNQQTFGFGGAGTQNSSRSHTHRRLRDTRDSRDQRGHRGARNWEPRGRRDRGDRDRGDRDRGDRDRGDRDRRDRERRDRDREGGHISRESLERERSAPAQRDHSRAASETVTTTTTKRPRAESNDSAGSDDEETLRRRRARRQRTRRRSGSDSDSSDSD